MFRCCLNASSTPSPPPLYCKGFTHGFRKMVLDTFLKAEGHNPQTFLLRLISKYSSYWKEQKIHQNRQNCQNHQNHQKCQIHQCQKIHKKQHIIFKLELENISLFHHFRTYCTPSLSLHFQSKHKHCHNLN